jgi:hypothetical protein
MKKTSKTNAKRSIKRGPNRNDPAHTPSKKRTKASQSKDIWEDRGERQSKLHHPSGVTKGKF